MKKILVLVMILMLAGLGCDKFKGMKGDTGATGATGNTGATGATGAPVSAMYKYEGVIVSNGNYYANLPIDITTSDVICVYYAPAIAPDIYAELGEPTGLYSGTDYRWATIGFIGNDVFFENMVAGDKWLITIVKKMG